MKHRQRRGFFDLLVCDETHQYKNESGQGYAFGALASACRYILCLTGTLAGVNDKAIGRSKAVLGVPPEVDLNRLKKSVYDSTDPKLTPVFHEGFFISKSAPIPK